MQYEESNRGIVARPELTDRFLDGLPGRISLVVAPLGFGKTTQLRQWQAAVEAKRMPAAYISLEAGRGKDTRLIQQVLEALSLAFDQTPSQSTEIDARWIIDHIDQRRTLLFLDDFQLARDEDEQLVSEILRMASNVHLVIASRETPKFALAKLRLSGLVNDFGPDDLRMDMSAATQLFPPKVDPDFVAKCVDYTGGWPAAMRLLHITLKDMSVDALEKAQSSAFHSDLAAYLNEQFFQQLPKEAQDILVGTAHLNDVNGDLANATTGRVDCWEQLDALATTHSLITHRPHENSYHYHQLLKDFLVQKQMRLGEEKVNEFHDRSARWFFAHDRLYEAVQHAVLAGNPGRAGRYLVEAGGVRIGFQAGVVRLSSLLELLPYEVIIQEPRLAVARGYELLKAARIQEAELVTNQVQKDHPNPDSALELDLAIVEGHTRVYTDHALRGEQLEAFAGVANAASAENPVLRGLLFNLLCLFQFQAGHFSEARSSGETALATFRDADAPYLQFFMHLHLGSISFEQGKVVEARQRYDTASEIQSSHFAYDRALWSIAEGFQAELQFEIDGARRADLSSVIDISNRAAAWSDFFLASYETAIAQAYQDGGMVSAIDAIEQAEGIALARPLPRFARHLTLLHLEYAALAGLKREAERLFDVAGRMDTGLDTDPLQWRGTLMRDLANARYQSRFGDKQSALSNLEETARTAAEQGYLRYAQRADVLCFLISVDLEEKARAVHHLVEAVLRIPDFDGVFLREGSTFTNAVRWTIRQAGISAFPDFARDKLGKLLNQAGAASALEDDFLAFFTPKEREILPGLASGAPNKVIARDLGLTDNTIKFHLKSIFAKLGVNSRKLAADILQSAGISD